MEFNVTKYVLARRPKFPEKQQIINITESEHVPDDLKQLIDANDEKALLAWSKKYSKSKKMIATLFDLPQQYRDVDVAFRKAAASDVDSVTEQEYWDPKPEEKQYETVMQTLVASLVSRRIQFVIDDKHELEQAYISLKYSTSPEKYEGPYYLTYALPHSDSSADAREVEAPNDIELVAVNEAQEEFDRINKTLEDVKSLIGNRRRDLIELQEQSQLKTEQMLRHEVIDTRAKDISEQMQLRVDPGKKFDMHSYAKQLAVREIQNEVDSELEKLPTDGFELADENHLSKDSLTLLQDYQLIGNNDLFSLHTKLDRLSTQANKKVSAAKSTNVVLMNPLFPPSMFARYPIQHEVKILGIGELKVLKEKLIRYEARDISHIENILAGEHKERVHERRRFTELFTDEITEREEKSLHELETSERHELQTATNAQIEAQFNNETWASASGSYGPIANFEAGTAIGIGGSTSLSSSANQTFGREVVTRAVEEISLKTTERITSTIINEVVETNTHGIDNRGDDPKNIAGIYQYLQKVLCVRQYNYGSRLLLHVTVPRPSENLLNFRRFDRARLLDELEEPPEFDVILGEISASNYEEHTAKFKAVGVEPPPELYTEVTATLNLDDSNILGEGSLKDLNQHLVDFLYSQYQRGARWAMSGEIEIPDGYEVVRARSVIVHPENIDETDFDFGDDFWSGVENFVSGTFVVNKYYPAASVINFNIGTTRYRRRYNLSNDSSPRDTTNTVYNSGISGKLAYGLSAWAISPGISVTIRVNCERTETALEKWRLSTYEKLYSGYITLKSIYEERLTVLEIQGAQPVSNNPEINRIQERNEIKSKIIDALNQHSGIEITAENYSDLMRFYELAIEWENINYKFITEQLAGHELQLRELKMLNENDTRHNDFLRAQGAMVIVPVRMEFVEKMLSLLEHGALHGYLDDIDNISYLLDLIGDPHSIKNEVPDGAPFEIEIPTSLVYLKTDGTLPVLGECTE